jgi:hypothetical protein
LNDILEQRDTGKTDNFLKALIIAPTRELAMQVCNHILVFARPLDIQAVSVVGGLSSEKQIRQLEKYPEIVIGTVHFINLPCLKCANESVLVVLQVLPEGYGSSSVITTPKLILAN